MNKTLQELLAIGIKAELEAMDAYSKLAKNVKNTILQERFESLAKDEQRHKIILEGLYEENFPGKAITLPEKSGVPKVNTAISDDNSIIEILTIVMQAEKKAEDYYRDLAGRLDNDEKKDLLNYLANIESGHYFFLKIEYDRAMKSNSK